MNKKYQKYINYIAKDIEPPYFKSLDAYGLKQDGIELVLSKIFNRDVRLNPAGSCIYDEYNNCLYHESYHNNWTLYEYDEEGNKVFVKDSNGNWVKYGYDKHGNRYTIDTNVKYYEL